MKKYVQFLFFIFILFACSNNKEAEKSISYDSTAKTPEQKESIRLAKGSIIPNSPDTLKTIALSTKQVKKGLTSTSKQNAFARYYDLYNIRDEIYTPNYELYAPKNFIDSLSYEANKKCTDTSSIVINENHLIANFLSSDSLRIYIDTLSRWQILFATSFSWNEYFVTRSGFSKHTISSPPKKFCCNNGKIYKGTELFEGLKIKAKYSTDTMIQNKIILRSVYSLGNNDEEKRKLGSCNDGWLFDAKFSRWLYWAVTKQLFRNKILF